MQKHGSSEKANLTVYRASAGSGKTHQLTGEFLRLLFSAPYAYRHILAVTFTNKATDEMKSRIVEELSNLASGRPSDYIEKLRSSRHNSEELIRETARTILIHILHDYSAFSISTIDRFFQQTMRAFARELGLGGGYNVELDTDKVLSEAIDSMLYDLEKKGNKQLLDWLIRFSEEKVESGETWNIKADIRSLSSEIFKESYKAFSDDVQEDIADKELMDDYKKMLLSYIRLYENQSRQIGEKGLNIMDRFNLKVDDFKGGARSPFGNFLKWAKGEIKEPTDTFLRLMGDVSFWYTKTTPADTKYKIEEAFSSGLNECVCDIISHYEDALNYQTAYEINRYFFTLGILGDVDRKIREYAIENNIMLISDTTELLNKITKETDTPFVYEKIGTYIDHYMIDEFQDTSNMQWTNFSPLIKDSLAAGKANLIVGDVKQSIYRWRNSDWNLLDEQLDIDFRNEGINHQTLDVNWRSLPNVVDFNNAVFSQGSSLLQALYNNDLPEDLVDNKLMSFRSKILKAYKGSYQQLPLKKMTETGRVEVSFIDRDEFPDWQQRSLEQLPVVIEQMQDKGYSLKDIAILVRTKKEGADVATALLEYKDKHPGSKYKYDIISDEALFLNASKSIKLIISLLRYLQKPSDISFKTLAVYEYYKFTNQLNAEDALNLYFSVSQDFPVDISVQLAHIRELPLYEMVEEIFNLFRDAMEENENVYIQAFLDTILDFTVRHISDLDSFLQWWDESGVRKTIFTPDGQDAVRIMTIHKSKGLGFNVVLLPFCNWDLDHKLTTILWCHPKQEPFNKLHLVPVKYSQKLKKTIFEFEYFDERLHAFVDNLNVLYVAFTRAKKELIAFAPKPKERDDLLNTSTLLWHCINKSIGIEETEDNKTVDLSVYYDDENGIFELGKDYIPREKQTQKTLVEEIPAGTLVNIPFEERLKLRLKNRYYFSDNGQRDYGTMMHEILSRVESVSDIEAAVEVYCFDGMITSAEKQKILDELDSFLYNPQVLSWYSGNYRILNEVQILQPDGSFVRPDRVMINDNEVLVVDYKFGELKNKKYKKQLSHYMEQITKMGYTHVKGYIWYVRLGNVEEVC